MNVNKNTGYLVFIGGGKSSLQTWGPRTYLFKRNEIFPEALPNEFITHLFYELPEQFRNATHEEIMKLLDAFKVNEINSKPEIIKKRPGRKPKVKHEFSTAS